VKLKRDKHLKPFLSYAILQVAENVIDHGCNGYFGWQYFVNLSLITNFTKHFNTKPSEPVTQP